MCGPQPQSSAALEHTCTGVGCTPCNLLQAADDTVIIDSTKCNNHRNCDLGNNSTVQLLLVDSLDFRVPSVCAFLLLLQGQKGSCDLIFCLFLFSFSSSYLFIYFFDKE